MIENMLFIAILLPILAGIAVLASGRRLPGTIALVTLAVALVNIVNAAFLFGKTATVTLPWAGFGMDFSLRLYHFSGFIMLATAFFALVISLYSTVFMRAKNFLNQFYGYLLLSVGFVNGAVLADNLIILLFFWEGLIPTLFGMIAIGRKDAWKTATKALIIVGISDLCMMVGMGITGHLAGTLAISQINLPLTGILANVAFLFLVIGAIAKAGSMPFHSWIPDAANDAPLPFMAFLPAALEKLLGIYFLARISLDMYRLGEHSWASVLLMVVGAITILFAVMMALIQKDYKRLLSYHAISQVGYMVLGIGTCLPVGIVGGLFHMINHALYKCCLFLTGGSVEKQAGTTDLAKLGGLGRMMPVTFICFIIAACSISGVPPFNGFFSKELVYDGALERGPIFYVAALLGSFLTAASFLKLGHAAFLGKEGESSKNVKESSWPILVPMIAIAFLCVLFGVWNSLPLNNLIVPIIGPERAAGHHFGGMPTNKMLIGMTIFVLAAAVFHHIKAAKISGSGLHASDHIRYAPGLSGVYDRAEKRFFDPYDIGLKIVAVVSKVTWWVDRKTDWMYDRFLVGVTAAFSLAIRRSHTGNYALYILWAIAGTGVLVFFAVK